MVWSRHESTGKETEEPDMAWRPPRAGNESGGAKGLPIDTIFLRLAEGMF